MITYFSVVFTQKTHFSVAPQKNSQAQSFRGLKKPQNCPTKFFFQDSWKYVLGALENWNVPFLTFFPYKNPENFPKTIIFSSNIRFFKPEVPANAQFALFPRVLALFRRFFGAFSALLVLFKKNNMITHFSGVFTQKTHFSVAPQKNSQGQSFRVQQTLQNHPTKFLCATPRNIFQGLSKFEIC